VNRPTPHQLLAAVLVLALAAGFAAWAFGPQAWREAALAWAGVERPERQRPAPQVEVTPARRATVEVTAEAVGTLRARESVVLTAEISGKVQAIRFAEGERVAAGDLLVELRADDERARLARAEAALREARLDLQRARDLETGRAIAAAEVDRLEAAEQSAVAEVALAEALLAKHRLRAPFAGHIGLRAVSPGSLVAAGERIAEIYADDPLELRFGLSQRLLADLHPGQSVRARTDAFPGETFTGKIVRIDPGVDPDTREFTVEAELPNADGRLRPGLFAAVEVVLQRREQAVVVPQEAVLRRGDATFVYVVGDDGTAERRDIRTGLVRPDTIEAREGLAAGEHVVTGGLQKVSPGIAVRPKGEDANPSGPPAGHGDGSG
jgi:membrane fusion protein (multidrug efflux system)